MKALQEIWTKNANNPHLLTGFDEYTKKYYMVTLITVAQINEKNFADKMKLIKQFCNEVGYIPETPDMTQEVKLAKTVSSKQLEDCTFLFRDNDIGKLLILDCLILTMTSDTDYNSTALYISDLAKLFEIDSNTMMFLSNLAAVISSGDLSKYNCDINNTSELYQYYLDRFDFSSYRRLFNADRVVKMWFDEQKEIVDWWETNCSPDSFAKFVSFDKNLVFHRTSEIIVDSTPKSITYYGHFNLARLNSYIGDKAEINEYHQELVFDELKKYEKVVIYTKHFILNEILEKKGKEALNGEEEILSFFSKYPIGIFTHCLDLKRNAESFFVNSGGEPNEIDVWSLCTV